MQLGSCWGSNPEFLLAIQFIKPKVFFQLNYMSLVVALFLIGFIPMNVETDNVIEYFLVLTLNGSSKSIGLHELRLA